MDAKQTSSCSQPTDEYFLSALKELTEIQRKAAIAEKKRYLSENRFQ